MGIKCSFIGNNQNKNYWESLVQNQSILTLSLVNEKRLKLIEQVDSVFLKLSYLKTNGLLAALQGPIRIKPDLANKYMNDTASYGFFPEEHEAGIYEGVKKEVIVNKYERSSIARKKCIEFHGKNCMICGFNFESTYGKIGKDFIHVHHIVPMHKIDSEYTVNYKDDLIPVCPNCHAMLHRKKDFLSIENLKKILLETENSTK